jgi:hypothetical protein
MRGLPEALQLASPCCAKGNKTSNYAVHRRLGISWGSPPIDGSLHTLSHMEKGNEFLQFARYELRVILMDCVPRLEIPNFSFFGGIFRF